MTAPNPACPRCGGAGWVEMKVTTTVEVSCPVCCAPAAAVLQRWRTANGWTPTTLACVGCGRPTHCRDADGTPRHRHCARECQGQMELAWSTN